MMVPWKVSRSTIASSAVELHVAQFIPGPSQSDKATPARPKLGQIRATTLGQLRLTKPPVTRSKHEAELRESPSIGLASICAQRPGRS